MTVAWKTVWQSLVSLSNSLYMELQCLESLCCTVGVLSPIKELSLGCSVIKWFADLTLKTTLCWWELHFCPGGELLWELTCFCSCCGTLVSLTVCNLPAFLRLCLAKAHLSFTVHILHTSLTHHLPAEEVTQIKPSGSSGASHLQTDHPIHDLFYLLWLLYETPNDDLRETSQLQGKGVRCLHQTHDSCLCYRVSIKAMSDFGPLWNVTKGIPNPT